MKITLVGVLGFLAVGALLVYVAYELRRANEEKQPPHPANPIPPAVNP